MLFPIRGAALGSGRWRANPAEARIADVSRRIGRVHSHNTYQRVHCQIPLSFPFRLLSLQT